MNILGIHIGHDSAAALIVDGKIIAHVAQERFVGLKHYAGLPTKSIKYCLDAATLSMENIDALAVPSQRDVLELNYLLELDERM